MQALQNKKHEHFAQLVSNGESAVRAYVLAGYSENGAYQSANRLLRNAEICSRIAHLRSAKESKHEKAVDAVVKSAAIDKAWVMNQLVEVVAMAKQAEPVVDNEGNPVGEYKQNLAAANKALELIGKEFAMFIDRKEIRTGVLDEMPIEELEALDAAYTAIRSARASSTANASGSQTRADPAPA